MVRSISIRNLLCTLLLSFSRILYCSNAAAQSALIVVGTVYCDTCFHQQFSKASRFISGASVAVECEDFKNEVKTNRHGVFRIRLPPKTDIKTCSVNLIKSSEPFCSIASSSSSTNLHLKSKKKNLHIYSSGFFTFRPLNQPDVCNDESSKKIQPTFFFPPIPFIPSPGLPLPPNPLVPPPSILPPVIPSPPPSVLPPFFPAPPPSLIPPIIPPLPLPPLPLITPPPPPPPASLFPPLPIPLPPNPLFPGIPPAPRSAENIP